MGTGYTGKKIQHGSGATQVYSGPAIDIAGLPVELQYAVCRYAAKFTYGQGAVRNVFGNAVKIGATNTIATVNQMANLGGLTGARPDEAAAFEADHPEWAATIKGYVAWKKGAG